MKIKLIMVGKTEAEYLKKGISIYSERIKHYLPFEEIIIPNIKNNKNFSKKEQKEKEGEQILKQISKSDYIILLDENGKEFSSMDNAGHLQKIMNRGVKNLVFVIGGPYGFSDKIYKIASEKNSLSKMTFSHQMIRLIFIEQLYRAFSILNNEPYHHQ